MPPLCQHGVRRDPIKMIEFPFAFGQLNFHDSLANCSRWVVLKADAGDLNHAAHLELRVVGEDIGHCLLKHFVNLYGLS